MNILIYSPSNLRAADQQAQAELLISMGHKVFLLTWLPEGILHRNFAALGATVASSASAKGRSIFFFINQAAYLARFCKKNKIDIVISHLQSNAVVAGMAKYFVKTRFFYMRHNSDYFTLNSSAKSGFLNKMANLLSPEIIAISNNVKEELLKEGVADKKIHRINLCYNFEHYETERLYNGEAIRTQYQAELVMICIARLDALKRHKMAFEATFQLCNEGFDCKLVCIGDGPYRSTLEQWITDHDMQEKIILVGFVPNVFDYLEAADLLLLLSYSEASSHAVKEAGICKKPVIVCNHVGDSGDYIIHNENSYLVNKENPVNETVVLLRHLFNNKAALQAAGIKLHDTIVKTFGIENVRKQYEQILNSN